LCVRGKGNRLGVGGKVNRIVGKVNCVTTQSSFKFGGDIIISKRFWAMWTKEGKRIYLDEVLYTYICIYSVLRLDGTGLDESCF
jgi:hypothetical protein